MDVNTHASGSSIEFLVNRHFKGVLQKISIKTNGFKESTTMDSGISGFIKNKHNVQQLQSLRNVLIWVLFSLKKV